MDAITLLTAQHDEVESLFNRFERSKDANSRQAVFNVIADNLAAHATIEERLFYPAIYVGDRQEALKDALDDHLEAKRVIADLLTMKASDPKFDARVRTLHEQIERHVEKEEGVLFSDVRKLVPKRELEALGEAMEEMFDKLMEGSPRNAVPGEVEQSATLS